MVGMIFEPQNKCFRHFLSFRNKLTLLPLKTYVLGAPRFLSPVYASAYCGRFQAVVGLVLDLLVLVPAPLATLLLSVCVSWYPLLLPAWRSP